LSREILLSLEKTSCGNSNYHPIFFARISGKKNNEDASLHFTEPSGSTSHLHAAKPLFTKTPFRLACEDAHFIPLVKSFRYRFTCEVAACRREDVFLFTVHLTVLK